MSSFRRLPIVVIGSLLICVGTHAQNSPAPATPQPLVRAHVEPADHLVVGQPVRLVVEVLVPNYFTGSPQFPELDIKNAIVVAPQETPQNFSERTGTTTYAGIRQTYFIYTEQPGTFRVPADEVKVKYADAPPHSIEAGVPLPAVKFRAEIPAAAVGLSYFLPTTKLIVEQRWTPPLHDLRAGQTVERTITVSAEKLQGMFLPPLPLDAPDGLRVYQSEPVVEDRKTDRGEFIGGKRVETTKYLIQKPGDYALPSFQISWWDLVSNRLRTEIVPAAHFSAAPDPNYAPELPPEPEPVVAAQSVHINRWRQYWLVLRVNWYWLAIALVAIWVIARQLPGILRWLKSQREAWRESEAAYFRRLIHNCEQNDAHAAYASLLHWLERAYPGRGLEQTIEQSGNPALRSEIAGLGAALYSPNPRAHWKGGEIAKSLSEFRSLSRRKIREAVQPLPALNPADGKST